MENYLDWLLIPYEIFWGFHLLSQTHPFLFQAQKLCGVSQFTFNYQACLAADDRHFKNLRYFSQDAISHKEGPGVGGQAGVKEGKFSFNNLSFDKPQTPCTIHAGHGFISVWS